MLSCKARRSVQLECPTVKITVGTQEDSRVFNLPIELLRTHSTYFDAVLYRRQPRNAHTFEMTLDNTRIDVFRTFVAWLYQQDCEGLTPVCFMRDSLGADAYQHHLVRLYIFADEYGIPALTNEIMFLLAKWTKFTSPLDDQSVSIIYERPGVYTPLNQFAVDDELACGYLFVGQERDVPHGFCVDVLSTLQTEGKPSRRPYEHICDYHEHDGNEERKKCMESLRAVGWRCH